MLLSWSDIGLMVNLSKNFGLVSTKLNFENTKHRYSWICSIRDPKRQHHFCAATLLSKPPKPTIFVTAAHCTYICKSDIGTVDNCCCENVGGLDCSDDVSKCGNDPKVYEMGGEDAVVLCGEWEIGKEYKDGNYHFIYLQRPP